MNDRFERFVADAARRLYHPPPETPRDEMWEEIRAARERSAARSDASRRRRSPIPWWAGVAAALAIGIGIGRLSLQRVAEEVAEEADAASPVALGGAPGEGAAPFPRAAGAGADAESAAVARAGGADAVAVPEAGAPASELPADPPAAAPAGRDVRPAPEAGGAERSRESLPLAYRVATARLLGRSETFLAAFRAERRTDRIDPAVSQWARELLASTRLLLDSPAAEDAAMGRLLADLELILAQIVQLGGAERPEEAEYIDEGLKRSRLIPRIQATASAVVPPAGT